MKWAIKAAAYCCVAGRQWNYKERQGIMKELAKKTVAALTECVEVLSKSGSTGSTNMNSVKIRALVELLKVIPERYLSEPTCSGEEMPDKEIRPDDDGAKERAYCALELAMIRLHKGQPLFFPFKEMSEYNAMLRRELIMALLLALDLLRQNGVSVEQTAQVEKIRRDYTSA